MLRGCRVNLPVWQPVHGPANRGCLSQPGGGRKRAPPDGTKLGPKETVLRVRAGRSWEAAVQPQQPVPAAARGLSTQISDTTLGQSSHSQPVGAPCARAGPLQRPWWPVFPERHCNATRSLCQLTPLPVGPGSPNRAHTGQPRRACPPSSRAKAHVGLARRPIAATGGILEVHSWPPPRQAQSQASAGDGSPDRPTWNPGSRGETPQAAPGDNAEQQLLASTGPTRLKGQWGHRRDAGPRSGPH